MEAFTGYLTVREFFWKPPDTVSGYVNLTNLPTAYSMKFNLYVISL